MVFLFCILTIFIIILLLIFSKITIKIEKLKYIFQDKNNTNNYLIIIKLYILNVIPIIKVKLTKEKIRKIKESKIMQKIEKINIQKIEENISRKKIKKVIKNFSFTIKDLKLELEIGTENASITALLIPVLNIIIAILIKNKIKNYKEQKFNIKPNFLNKNILNLQFSGIFEIKMIHIINIIYILNKKEGVKKYERTSNRRSYANNYE